MYTGNIPIEEEIKTQAATTYIKTKSLNDQSWVNSKIKVELITQKDPITIINTYLDTQKIPSQVKQLPRQENPIEYAHYDIQTDLLELVNKKMDSPEILKQLALQTINVKYPSDKWLRVYTDGSLIAEGGEVGAGVYCEHFSHYIGIGQNKTVFEGESQAILFALTQLLYRQKIFEKAVILVDSKSVIQAISSRKKPKTSTIQEIKKLLTQISRLKKHIAIQWIPAHVGLQGNEIADNLAKKGTTLTKTNIILDAQEIKTLLKKRAQQNYKLKAHEIIKDKQWANIQKEWAINKHRPRKEAVATFRLKTGHDCLAAHLYKINIFTTEECTLCQQPETVMNANHLLTCRKLDAKLQQTAELTKLYWSARFQMS